MVGLRMSQPKGQSSLKGTRLARIDRISLDKAHFPVTVSISTRFADLDFQGHVNNAAVPVILQEARVDFNKAIDLAGQLHGLRMMVAGITIEYAAELRHPEQIEIGTGVSKIGRTSFTIQQTARQNGRTVIYAETTLVVADENGAVPLADALRSDLEQAMRW
jgi:acyl-CoA thioester hydrolase